MPTQLQLQILCYAFIFVSFCFCEDKDELGEPNSTDITRLLNRKSYSSEGDNFLFMSEFEYGQKALYNEPCNLTLYEELVEPIYGRMVTSRQNVLPPSWIVDQRSYAEAMKNNLSIRAATCHADHLMQCSPIKNYLGVHTCECLQLSPIYNLEMDEDSNECRVKNGARCFTPFGLKCFHNSVCKQLGTNTGECICIDEETLDEYTTTDNCSGYAAHVEKDADYLNHLPSPPPFDKKAKNSTKSLLNKLRTRVIKSHQVQQIVDEDVEEF